MLESKKLHLIFLVLSSLVCSILFANSSAQASELRLTQISTGFAHTCSVDKLGNVYCWGNNEVGQIGVGTTNSPIAPATKLPNFSKVKMVSAGAAHNCVIDKNENLYCWGQNGNGKLGIGTLDQSNSPVKVNGIAKVKFVHASRLATCAISNGDVYCFGSNEFGELQTESKDKNVLVPSKVPGISEAKKVLVGTQVACALVSGNKLYCWGTQSNGRLGNGLEDNKAYPPTQMELPEDVIDFGVGAGHICAITGNEGNLYCWGYGEKGQLGNSVSPISSATPTKVNGLKSIKKVHLNRFGTCALDVANQVFCWGGGEYLQNGNTERKDTNSPVLISNLKSVKILSTSSSYTSHMCAIENSGDTKCWGYGSSLQLGNSVQGDLAIPVKIFETASSASKSSKPSKAGQRDVLIQCKKGKQLKEVIGVAPKCPSGFSEVLIKKPKSVFYLDLKLGCYSANYPVTSLIAPTGREDYKTLFESDCKTPYHFQVIFSGQVKTTNGSPLPTQDEIQTHCVNQYKSVFGTESPRSAKPGGIFLSWFFPDAGFEASKYPQRGICYVWKWDVNQTYGAAPYAMAVTSPMVKRS